MTRRFAIIATVLLCAISVRASEPKLKALIIDGQNNHGQWPKTTIMMKKYLTDTGLFSVEIARTAYTWQGDALVKEFPIGVKTTALKQPKPDPDYKPSFSHYDVVISNFGNNTAPWPQQTQQAFVAFMKGGGGLVVVHAADNAFGNWDEYNKMIGIGGWGGRSEKSGPYVYVDDSGKVVRDTSPGRGGNHGPQHEFQITIRDSEHPITKGMPKKWLHARDELYDQLRGPATNMTILATAYADPKSRGTGRHEPMMMTVRYGRGRVFHTPMGHADYSQECVGFIVSLTRGAEWAATGKVTQTAIPDDFPTENKTSQRAF